MQVFTIALVWFVIHCWRKKAALVNLHIFKDWNFAIGCGLMTLFGMAVYSTITVLPLYYQELLGYTAFAAGWAVGPRGFGAIAAMPMIGWLSSRVDARYLLTFGFILFGVVTLSFGNATLEISPTTLLWPIIIMGFAFSFVFVPITTQAYGTLRNEQIGNASGIFNLVRNIGGSVGISLAQTMLTRRADTHQNEMTNYVARTQIWFQQHVSSLASYLGNHIGPANSRAGARFALYQNLGQQALHWAFVDVFRWTALLSFACVLLVWFFRKVKQGRPPAGAH